MNIGAVYVTVRMVKESHATIYGSEHGEELTRRMYPKKRKNMWYRSLISSFLVLLEMRKLGLRKGLVLLVCSKLFLINLYKRG